MRISTDYYTAGVITMGDKVEKENYSVKSVYVDLIKSYCKFEAAPDGSEDKELYAISLLDGPAEEMIVNALISALTFGIRVDFSTSGKEVHSTKEVDKVVLYAPE